MSAVVMRSALETDAGAVGAILSAFIDDTDWMPRIHTRAEDLAHAGSLISRGWVTVAERSAVIGFAARDRHSVHALYVSQDHRGQGVGTGLLEVMKSQAEHLSLWTFQANTGAQRFYLRNGFVERERTDGSGNDEGLPDIRYDWMRSA